MIFLALISGTKVTEYLLQLRNTPSQQSNEWKSIQNEKCMSDLSKVLKAGQWNGNETTNEMMSTSNRLSLKDRLGSRGNVKSRLGWKRPIANWNANWNANSLLQKWRRNLDKTNDEKCQKRTQQFTDQEPFPKKKAAIDAASIKCTSIYSDYLGGSSGKLAKNDRKYFTLK